MPRPFPELLAEHLKAAGVSARAFATRQHYDQASLVGVLKGRRKPPVEAIERWADALHLRGRDREDFLVAGWSLHSAPGLVDLVEKLRARRR